MSRDLPKTTRLLAALAVCLAALLVAPATVSADNHTDAALTCADFVHGGGTYERVITGKKKAPVYNGTLSFGFDLESASCAGATYTITISSADGTALGWTTTSSAPNATTSASPDGDTVTVSYVGDGATQQFSIAGTTAGYVGDCLHLTGNSALTGLTLDTAPDAGVEELCHDSGAGGFNFR